MFASLVSPAMYCGADLDTALVSGGDSRLNLDPATGLNRYACQPRPDPGLLDFASATASVISPEAWQAVAACYESLAPAAPGFVARWCQALEALRSDLASAFGAHACQTLLAPSGTDLHGLAMAIAAQSGTALSVLLPDPAETGSGVPAALRQSQGQVALHGLPTLSLRGEDGRPRAPAEWQAHADPLLERALVAGHTVLLPVLDVSKTGLMMPSAAWVLGWMARAPQQLRVLVDACQLRMSSEHVTAWLRAGAMVAVTGSKFLAGPSFSGALFVPSAIPCARQEQILDEAGQPNVGLLLRWRAAFRQWQTLSRAEPERIASCLRRFAQDVAARLACSPKLQLLDGLLAQRQDLPGLRDWDACPSIFPLRLQIQERFLSPAQVHRVYQALPLVLAAQGPMAARVHLGQPVLCPNPDGSPGAVLRLCLSARQVCTAIQGPEAYHRLWQETLTVLAKLEGLLEPHFCADV